jgi:hypothetical protein
MDSWEVLKRKVYMEGRRWRAVRLEAQTPLACLQVGEKRRKDSKLFSADFAAGMNERWWPKVLRRWRPKNCRTSEPNAYTDIIRMVIG